MAHKHLFPSTPGKAPYAKVRGSEMGTYLKQGKRMEKPEFADDM